MNNFENITSSTRKLAEEIVKFQGHTTGKLKDPWCRVSKCDYDCVNCIDKWLNRDVNEIEKEPHRIIL